MLQRSTQYKEASGYDGQLQMQSSHTVPLEDESILDKFSTLRKAIQTNPNYTHRIPRQLGSYHHVNQQISKG